MSRLVLFLGMNRIENKCQLEAVARRCHINLDHPSRERFMYIIEWINTSQKTIEMAKNLKYITCRYKYLQISKYPRTKVFKEQIYINVLICLFTKIKF